MRTEFTAMDVIEVWETFSGLSHNSVSKVTSKKVANALNNKYSSNAVGRIIVAFEAIKRGGTSRYCNFNKVAEVYFMDSRAPEYLRTWRRMQYLVDQDSVNSLAKQLAATPGAKYSEATYKSIHKVFSSFRDGKTVDINNEALKKVATAYFKLVSPSVTHKKRKRDINYIAIYEDYCNCSNRQEVAKNNNCTVYDVDRAKRIFNCVRDNIPPSDADYKQHKKIIRMAEKYFNTKMCNTTPTAVIDNPFPVVKELSKCVESKIVEYNTDPSAMDRVVSELASIRAALEDLVNLWK